MSVKTFVNLPVKDLDRSKAFFSTLGFSFDQRFTDDKAACLVISEESYVMLLTEPFFEEFTKKEIADAGAVTEAIIALGVESRQRVDDLVNAALSEGGKPSNEPQDQGFMYARSFQDPDGHLWEVVFMDPGAMSGRS
ncbi:glyoxalase [Wenjunlia vitaminophila]|uniref:Glyoxalase n=1 Tax=Wenjunlia vitaminophila TaxID=76728 RepID=A0A0T6LQ06_WENVI|nr:VOC family protein [Wenjunlia vitaminophila]KRV48128.1 glyoxalase [Wenjunlia vitaminophila]